MSHGEIMPLLPFLTHSPYVTPVQCRGLKAEALGLEVNHGDLGLCKGEHGLHQQLNSWRTFSECSSSGDCHCLQAPTAGSPQAFLTHPYHGVNALHPPLSPPWRDGEQRIERYWWSLGSQEMCAAVKAGAGKHGREIFLCWECSHCCGRAGSLPGKNP